MKSTDSKWIAKVQVIQGQTCRVGWHCTSTFTSLQLNTKQLQQSFHKLPAIYIIILKLASISLAELVPRLSTRRVGRLEREQTITLTWCEM